MLFTNRPALEKSQLARCQPISFKARDGMTIYGYLTLPMGVPSKNLPLVLNVHGGPWGRDSWGLDNEAQWLANRLDFYGRTEEFLAKYLGGRAEPVQKVEDSSAEAM